MKNVAIFGDSVSKGVIYDPKIKRYTFGNGIDWKTIEHKLNIKVENYSRMGATITYGYEKLKKYLDNNPEVDTIVLEYGGNDCDFDWAKVAEVRSKNHQPNTPINLYRKTLVEMIQLIKSKNIKPIVLTLPTIHSKKYYRWIGKSGIDMKNVLYFLGDVEHIYRHHELYNVTVQEVAKKLDVELIDIRKVFLNTEHPNQMICKDGIHPTIYAEQLVVDYVIDYMITHYGEIYKVPKVSKLAMNFYQKEPI